MTKQCIQWVRGPNKGKVEFISEMKTRDDGIDLVVLENGIEYFQDKIRENVIFLPENHTPYRIDEIDELFQDNQFLEDKSISAVSFKATEKDDIKSNDSFAHDLLKRSKKKSSVINMGLELDLPLKSFIQMINDTFNESTLTEVIDIIVKQISIDDIKQELKNSIIKFYNIKD